MQTKTIVMDIDDTISTHYDRDYENAVPHQDVIDKINRFYDAGWKVVLHTARGMESLDGDIDRIKAERGPTLVKWLLQHGVQYHELQFGKPLGVMYVDDKALRPDEFVNLTHEILKGGSGATVERVGERVVKKTPLTILQKNWFKRYDELAISDIFLVPEVYSYYGNTLEMQYVHGQPLNRTITFSKFLKLIELVKSFAHFEHTKKVLFQTMIDRVKKHMYEISELTQEERHTVFRYLEHFAPYFDRAASFSHGDLTLENIVDTEDGHFYLLDPIAEDELYSSWIMDCGKILQSIDAQYELVFGDNKTNVSAYEPMIKYMRQEFSDRDFKLMKVAEMIWFIRMIKYKKDPDDRTLAIGILKRLIAELKTEGLTIVPE